MGAMGAAAAVRSAERVHAIGGGDDSDAAAAEWDGFVAATHGGDVVQTSAWAQAKRALGLDVCPVLVRSGAGIVGGAQILIKRFGPFGGIGYVPRGPLLASEDRRHAAGTLDEIERAARAQRVRHLIVQPPESGDWITAELAARGYMPDAPEVAPTASVRLDLSLSLDQLMARMSSSRRGEIRKGQRRGLEIRFGDGGDLDAFHTLHQATAERQGFKSVSRRYLQLHWDALHPHGFALLVLAYHEGATLAGLWLTAFRDTVTERLTGYNFEGRRLFPTIGCRWAAIQWAKERGYRYYDFGGFDRRHAELLSSGLPLPEEFHRTPDAFKREFGSAPVLFPTASQRTLNPLIRPAVQYLYPRIARSEALRKFVHRLRNG